MGLESATFISQLVSTNPPGADDRSTADDHLRLIKAVLKAQFTNFDAVAVTATPAQVNGLVGLTASKAVATNGLGVLTTVSTSATELGYVSGVTSAIQTQLNAKQTVTLAALKTEVADLSGVTDVAAARANLGALASPIAPTDFTAITAGTTVRFFSSPTGLTPVFSTTSYVNATSLLPGFSYIVQRAGTYRCQWNLTSQLSSLASSVIYVNGALFGAVKTSTSSSSVSQTDDLVFAAGDLVEIYGKTDAFSVSIDSFTISGTASLLG